MVIPSGFSSCIGNGSPSINELYCMLIFKKKFSKGQEAAENSWLGGRASVSQVGRGDYLVGSGPGRAGLAGKDGRMHWAGPGRGHGHGLVGPGRAWELDGLHWR